MDDALELLTQHGWSLPHDPLATEILETAIVRWGTAKVIAGLRRELTGPFPSYALEPIGRALGEQYECPHQLVAHALG
jgi:hypothetical protein